MFEATAPGMGTPFQEYLYDRAGAVADARGARQLAVRIWAYLQEYDHLRSSLERVPTDREHAHRWNLSAPSVERTRREVRMLFPGMSPADVLDELWRGVALAQRDEHPNWPVIVQLNRINVVPA